ILSSAVTNVIVANFQVAMKPEPPFVTRDFSGSLFEEFVMAVAMDRNELLLVESRFQIAHYSVDCRMYLLPLAKSDEKLTFAADVEQLTVQKKNIKILVIDDSPSDCEIMKAFLSKEGYDVVTVESATEGLIRLSQEYFDLTLCDYNMPEINGEGFIERVRQDAVLRSSVVIIVTSEQDTDIKVRLLKNGANDFIHKGAAREEILARIDAHLHARANAHAYAGAVWMDALVKMFGLLTEMRADIEAKNMDQSVLLEKIKQMEQTIDKVVSKVKK
ncbi:MAG: response regulator, partial [Candidatus Omnitrophica bacterium]|nr:response regulator [Candidatus Omnitrophota bacterium]